MTDSFFTYHFFSERHEVGVVSLNGPNEELPYIAGKAYAAVWGADGLAINTNARVGAFCPVFSVDWNGKVAALGYFV